MQLKQKKGSILAYSLIILSMMFAIVGSITTVTVLEKSSVGASQSSAQAFQAADSGVQIAIKKINSVLKANDTHDKLTDAFASPACDHSSGAALVSNNFLDSDSTIGFDLSFYDLNNVLIASCDKSVKDIRAVKSVGNYKNSTRAVRVSIGDYDSFTKLILHADGEGNVFQDAATNKVITAHGGATQSSLHHMFSSGKSATFNGSTDYLSLESGIDLDFDDEDFTIDFWERSNDVTTDQMFALSLGQVASKNVLDFDFNDPSDCGGAKSSLWVFWRGIGNENKICVPGLAGALTDGGWHHIALVRDGNKFTLFVDGIKKGDATDPGIVNLSGAKKSFIGVYENLAEIKMFHWNGNLDEIRISKGKARWTSNFAVETVAY